MTATYITPTRACRECGGPIASQDRRARYCSSKCRKDFFDRRSKRGAELYDLFMTIRHEREIAKEEKLWTYMTRLAMYYKEEDEREREGRKSWGPWRDVIENKPYIAATARGVI